MKSNKTKFILTETEKFDENYRHQETFSTYEQAQARLKELYHETAVEGNQNAIESATLDKNSALIRFNDGNEVEYDLEEVVI